MCSLQLLPGIIIRSAFFFLGQCFATTFILLLVPESKCIFLLSERRGAVEVVVVMLIITVVVVAFVFVPFSRIPSVPWNISLLSVLAVHVQLFFFPHVKSRNPTATWSFFCNHLGSVAQRKSYKLTHNWRASKPNGFQLFLFSILYSINLKMTSFFFVYKMSIYRLCGENDYRSGMLCSKTHTDWDPVDGALSERGIPVGCWVTKCTAPVRTLAHSRSILTSLTSPSGLVRPASRAHAASVRTVFIGWRLEKPVECKWGSALVP